MDLEETVKEAKMPKVPRPAVFGWGVGLVSMGFIIAFFGVMDEYNGGASLIFAASIMALGWPMFLLGLLIHAIRVEGTATRAGVLPPYLDPQLAPLTPEELRKAYPKSK